MVLLLGGVTGIYKKTVLKLFKVVNTKCEWPCMVAVLELSDS